MADPGLTTAKVRDARARVPQNRYVMAGGCYRLRGEAIHFQATELGTYVLYNRNKKFLTGTGDRVSWAGRPSTDAEFTVRRRGDGFTFTLPSGAALTRTADGTRLTSRATAYPLRLTTGCAAYPEIGTGVSGRPHAGVTDIQEVRGYVDAHTHGMAYEFLGGEVHCGKPWDKYGVAFALVDCKDHTLTTGKGAALEAVAVRPPDARPGRLADVQGLAGTAVADPRGHLLEVDGALLARRAAGVRQPARRERPALHDLPAQAQLVRRDDLDPPAGQADAAVRELHRRAVRRARQGLVPHRHQPVAGPQGDQRRASSR